MKKIITSLIAMLLIFATAQPAFAQSGTSGELSWSITNNTLTISVTAETGNAPMCNFTQTNEAPWSSLPFSAVIIEDRVTSISFAAFAFNENLTSATIGNDVETLGIGAFFSTGLTSITLPNSVTTIGNQAFQNNPALTTVTIPSSVTSIGTQAFSVNPALVSVTVEWDVPLSITSLVFFGLPANARLNVPAGTEDLYRNAPVWGSFLIGDDDPNVWRIGSPNMADVTATLSNNTLAISGTGDMMHFNQTWDATLGHNITTAPWGSASATLETIDIGNGVTSIGFAAFMGSVSLTSVNLPSSLITIGGSAFANTSLTSVIIPNNVITIGGSAFSGSTALASVVIGESVETIEGSAFAQTGLTSVTVPSSVTTIGAGAFGGNAGLTDINVASGNLYFSSENGVVFNVDQTSLLIFPSGRQGEYTVPNSVITIEVGAFVGTRLTSVIIPNSVITIGGSAFSNNPNLTSVIIGENVETIEGFAFSNTPNLTSVISLNPTPPALAVNAFGWEPLAYLCVFVPAGSLSAYQAAEGWSELACIQALLDYFVTFNSQGGTAVPMQSVATGGLVTEPTPPTRAGFGFEGWYTDTDFTDSWDFATDVVTSDITLFAKWGAARGTSGLLSWIVSDDTLRIRVTAETGEAPMEDFGVNWNYSPAFTDAPWGIHRNYFSVAIVENRVTTIGQSALRGTGLISVHIGENVTAIGWDVFEENTGLTAIHVASGNPMFSSEDGVLFTNTKTTLMQFPQGRQGAYTIPNSVTVIGWGAFQNAIGLTSIVIPNSVIRIESSAFFNTGLTSVTIPSGVSHIDGEIFSGSANLTSINVVSDNPYLRSEDGVVFNTDKTTLVAFPPGRAGAYTIPNSVITIGFNAFIQNRGLTSIVIGENVEIIGQQAFFGTGLMSVIIPNSVTTIEGYAFTSANLRSVTIGSAVTAIESGAFAWNSNLTTVISLSPTPPTLEYSWTHPFQNISANACLFVLRASVEAYENDADWGSFFSCIQAFTHTVTFNAQGGSAVANQTVGHGETAERPTNPTRVNYVFEGWYSDTEFATVWDFATSVVTSDTTLFARWTFDETTNIAEVQLIASVQVFPNPFINEIHIADAAGFSLQVFTQTGAIVHTQQIVNSIETVNLHHLPTGIFILRLEKNGEIRTARIIKQ